LWRRELKRFIRDHSRLVSSVISPVLWLVIFGGGLGFSIADATGLNYTQFLLPGIISQTLLFTAMFLGISVIWDRQFGFMKEILVAPINRISIFTGKMLGVGSAALIQGLIVVALRHELGNTLNDHHNHRFNLHWLNYCKSNEHPGKLRNHCNLRQHAHVLPKRGTVPSHKPSPMDKVGFLH